ncbi:hypothetical protein CBR_g52055 [Chara braunii]|uniref:Uncharacterized protein n=1 Tax=Chara braunii TaxID=69332 RepID=A0A388M9L2_CHABU|nr:hypothetical protein CBR_g52055 [Chara braunii]|eukprot:GBG91173.1 hypothetical protein CBR_g52055 [Chara braunii]
MNIGIAIKVGSATKIGIAQQAQDRNEESRSSIEMEVATKVGSATWIGMSTKIRIATSVGIAKKKISRTAMARMRTNNRVKRAMVERGDRGGGVKVVVRRMRRGPGGDDDDDDGEEDDDVHHGGGGTRLSELWKAAAAEEGTQLQMTSGNHPEANGQAEQLNRAVQHLLRHYIKPNQGDWDEKLALIASLYNKAVHSATGAIEQMHKAQAAMIDSENKHRCPSTFQVGERVWVKSAELGQEHVISRKLMPQYFGPWEVLDVVGDEPDGPSYVIRIPGHRREAGVGLEGGMEGVDQVEDAQEAREGRRSGEGVDHETGKEEMGETEVRWRLGGRRHGRGGGSGAGTLKGGRGQEEAEMKGKGSRENSGGGRGKGREEGGWKPGGVRREETGQLAFSTAMYGENGSRSQLSQVWDYEDGCHVTAETHSRGGTFRAAKFLPSKDWVVVFRTERREHSILVFEMRQTLNLKMGEFKEVKSLRMKGKEMHGAYQDNTYILAVNPSSRYILTTGLSAIHIWDLNNGWEKFTFSHQYGIKAVSFHPLESQVFATGGSKGEIKVFDCERRSVLEQYVSKRHITSVQFCSDGRKSMSLLVSGNAYGKVEIWDYKRKEHLATLAHKYFVKEAFFHPHWPYVFSASSDGTVKVWSASNYKLVTSYRSGLRELSSMALCRDSNMLVLGGKETFLAIELKEAKQSNVDANKRVNMEVPKSEQEWEKGFQEHKSGHRNKDEVHAETVQPLRTRSNTLVPGGKENYLVIGLKAKANLYTKKRVRMEEPHSRKEQDKSFQEYKSRQGNKQAVHAETIQPLGTADVSNPIAEGKALEARLAQLESEHETGDRLRAERIEQLKLEVSNLMVASEALQERFKCIGSEHETNERMHAERIKEIKIEVGDLIGESEALKERFEQSESDHSQIEQMHEDRLERSESNEGLIVKRELLQDRLELPEANMAMRVQRDRLERPQSNMALTGQRDRLDRPESHMILTVKRESVENGLERSLSHHEGNQCLHNADRIKKLQIKEHPNPVIQHLPLSDLTVKKEYLEERLDRPEPPREENLCVHVETIKQLETKVSDLVTGRKTLKRKLEQSRLEHEENKRMHVKRIKQLGSEVSNLMADGKALKEKFEQSRSAYEKDRRTHAENIIGLEMKVAKLTAEREELKARLEKLNFRAHQLERELGVQDKLDRFQELQTTDQEPHADQFWDFSFEELQAATDNFHDNCKLEDRHYGRVYAGMVTPIMIKKLHLDQKVWNRRHTGLTREIVDRLRSLRHPHLQTLLGVCYRENCLVFEHMANGSVKEWISCEGGARREFLPWRIRLRVMAEVAKALFFLHSNQSAAGGPIIHHAIRPENILLDSNFVAKISEVDVALLVPDQAPEACVFPGTSLQYLAPEFCQTGVFDQKADIYSFGITILEMLTGKFKNAFGTIAEAVEDAATFRSALDPNAGNWDVDLAQQAARLGLRCASLECHNRPSMKGGKDAILPRLYDIVYRHTHVAQSTMPNRRQSIVSKSLFVKPENENSNTRFLSAKYVHSRSDDIAYRDNDRERRDYRLDGRREDRRDGHCSGGRDYYQDERRDMSRERGETSGEYRRRAPPTCFECGQVGHYRNQCWKLSGEGSSRFGESGGGHRAGSCETSPERLQLKKQIEELGALLAAMHGHIEQEKQKKIEKEKRKQEKLEKQHRAVAGREEQERKLARKNAKLREAEELKMQMRKEMRMEAALVALAASTIDRKGKKKAASPPPLNSPSASSDDTSDAKPTNRRTRKLTKTKKQKRSEEKAVGSSPPMTQPAKRTPRTTRVRPVRLVAKLRRTTHKTKGTKTPPRFTPRRGTPRMKVAAAMGSAERAQFICENICALADLGADELKDICRKEDVEYEKKTIAAMNIAKKRALVAYGSEEEETRSSDNENEGIEQEDVEEPEDEGAEV